jgi:hypothetical protein
MIPLFPWRGEIPVRQEPAGREDPGVTTARIDPAGTLAAPLRYLALRDGSYSVKRSQTTGAATDTPGFAGHFKEAP